MRRIVCSMCVATHTLHALCSSLFYIGLYCKCFIEVEINLNLYQKYQYNIICN